MVNDVFDPQKKDIKGAYSQHITFQKKTRTDDDRERRGIKGFHIFRFNHWQWLFMLLSVSHHFQPSKRLRSEVLVFILQQSTFDSSESSSAPTNRNANHGNFWTERIVNKWRVSSLVSFLFVHGNNKSIEKSIWKQSANDNDRGINLKTNNK